MNKIVIPEEGSWVSAMNTVKYEIRKEILSVDPADLAFLDALLFTKHLFRSRVVFSEHDRLYEDKPDEFLEEIVRYTLRRVVQAKLPKEISNKVTASSIMDISEDYACSLLDAWQGTTDEMTIDDDWELLINCIEAVMANFVVKVNKPTEYVPYNAAYVIDNNK